MSASIGAGKSRFTIFGAGYDYTLADSGDGEKMFFSNRSVPLGSVNYAGQYYFVVPNADGDPVDAVKDDIAHVTFDPALGTEFDTEGEVTVKIHYRREYDLPDETILVEKELEQVITVVDHGNITTQHSQTSLCDIYSDGYCFWHPYEVNFVQSGLTYKMPDSNEHSEIVKTSNIPWRASRLGDRAENGEPFIYSTHLTDISELVDAQVSDVSYMNNLFYNCSALEDITALSTWDANPTEMTNAFAGCISIKSLEALSGWCGANGLTKAKYAFAGVRASSLRGLENWKTSWLTTAEGMFESMVNLTDISALANWDMYNVTTMFRTFKNTGAIDISPIGNWNTSNVTTMEEMFSASGITTAHGIHWNTSKVTITHQMFYQSGLNDISDIEWDVTKVTDAREMFRECAITSFAGMVLHFDKVNMSYFAYDSKLHTFAGMGSWTAIPTAIDHAFGMLREFASTSPAGIGFLDFSEITSLETIFDGGQITSPVRKFITLDGLGSWDVSTITNFNGLFNNCHFLQDLSAISGWNFGAVTNAHMFSDLKSVESITELAGWDVSSWTAGAFSGMFGSGTGAFFSPKLHNIIVYQYYEGVYERFRDYNGDTYSRSMVEDSDNPLIPIGNDASGVDGWNVPANNLGAFGVGWHNRPTWN